MYGQQSVDLHLMRAFARTSSRYVGRMPMSSWQPIPAYLGLFGCLFMIFVCGSSLWWSSSATAGKILGAYGAVSGFPYP